ncbi:ABC transporter permease [Paenibacillus barcinonensis]|uniref:Nickel import system permease protein NikB n=1 Tax=Paenibacillus barcinonensis TaxID=198119 RepID=A0A2V4VDR7_PAEBA|nr:nickel ABC transporter permease [Paenibacillus barcinonensis]PYE44402.1 peptide/nickel transport system permease protein [Paenibacillus barcinonensis]QKS58059.1 ABC transporter permease [Paenibacillus barcinonensis]
MGRYIFKRLLQLIAVLFGITFLTFLLTYLSPGDPARLMLMSTGVTPSDELVRQVRSDLGLDQPFLVRYGTWLAQVVAGDFGTSYKYGRPVLDVLMARLPATLWLTGSAMLLVILISFPLGILSAVHRNRLLDAVIRLFSFAGLSMPSFWLGMLLMLVFGVQLRLLPVMGSSGWTSLILPAITLAIPLIAQYSRQIRVVLLEESSQNYVVGARARGVKESIIMWRHILPNAMLPIVTLMGMTTGALLGGAAIVESLFVWPGVGQMAVDAIFTRDYPLIQGYVMWMAIIYVTLNLLVDLWTHLRDPRIQLDVDV